MDSLFFLIDDSLSVDIVSYMNKMEGENIYDGYKEYPFSYINPMPIIGLLGIFITMFSVKKDGQLIKNKLEEF